MMQWSKELNYEMAGEASAKKLQPSNIINIIVMYLCLKIHPFFNKMLRCFFLVSPFPWFHFREDKSQTSVVFFYSSVFYSQCVRRLHPVSDQLPDVGKRREARWWRTFLFYLYQCGCIFTIVLWILFSELILPVGLHIFCNNNKNFYISNSNDILNNLPCLSTSINKRTIKCQVFNHCEKERFFFSFVIILINPTSEQSFVFVAKRNFENYWIEGQGSCVHLLARW